MGTPLGPKYIPYTYMDPLGMRALGTNVEYVLRSIWIPGVDIQRTASLSLMMEHAAANHRYSQFGPVPSWAKDLLQGEGVIRYVAMQPLKMFICLS